MINGSVEYDSEGDVLYVHFAPGRKVAKTVSLDDLRLIDYSDDGAVVGLEFIDASAGVDLRDVPFAHTAEQIIGDADLGLRVYAS